MKAGGGGLGITGKRDLNALHLSLTQAQLRSRGRREIQWVTQESNRKRSAGLGGEAIFGSFKDPKGLEWVLENPRGAERKQIPVG